MTNVIFVAAGQCGNQLCFELLNHLKQHAFDRKYHTSYSNMESLSRQRLIDTFFSSRYLYGGEAEEDQLVARCVCLDTEPKVIDDCLQHTQRHGHWQYDTKSIAYRHGGAGNNWALGYAMASGEYLDTSLNCIRRQCEQSDYGSMLLFIHSLAGGTGSGLGTKLTEACVDAFPDLFRATIAIAPHHFGEVVVQYYNALLCLAKVSTSNHAVLVFENEVAQHLCKEMKGISRPLLKDLNHAIASNLLPILLPKIAASNNISGKFASLDEDLGFLCAHPAYRFVNVKLSPQTSQRSIDFTFDSWSGLLKTIQRLQMSGTLVERYIAKELKNFGSLSSNTSPSHLTVSSSVSTAAEVLEQTGGQSVVRTLGSIITCHGDQAASAAQDLADATFGDPKPDAIEGKTRISLASASKSYTSRKSTAGPSIKSVEHLLPEFLTSHSSLLSSSSSRNVQINSSTFALNRYQRSCSLLANDQSILSVLQRPWQRSQELFAMRAYMHQYEMHGLEQGDFVEAFRSLSSTIHNYSSL
jgi:hypothetical protein